LCSISHPSLIAELKQKALYQMSVCQILHFSSPFWGICNPNKLGGLVESAKGPRDTLLTMDWRPPIHKKRVYNQVIVFGIYKKMGFFVVSYPENYPPQEGEKRGIIDHISIGSPGATFFMGPVA